MLGPGDDRMGGIASAAGQREQDGRCDQLVSFFGLDSDPPQPVVSLAVEKLGQQFFGSLFVFAMCLVDEPCG